VLRTGTLEADCAPRRETTVALDLSFPQGANAYLNLTYRLKHDTPYAKAGHLAGYEQLVLHEVPPALPALCAASAGALTLEESETRFVVTGPHFRYVFDRISGNFSEMVYDNHTLLKAPMEYNIWRAPTDNDRGASHDWRRAGYNRATVKVYSSDATLQDGIAHLSFHLSLIPVFLGRILEINGTWKIDANGVAVVALDCEKADKMPFLPRFGLRLFMPKQFDRVSYFGYGPYESYIDKRRASRRGRFDAPVADLHEDYLRPQENGSHYGCDHVTLSKPGLSFKAVAAKPFCFNASPYTQEELAAKRHNYELTACGDTVLCLDYAQSGLGSNSCGPALMEKYRFNEARFTFTLALVPERHA
jgi:beta-galactosidase